MPQSGGGGRGGGKTDPGTVNEMLVWEAKRRTNTYEGRGKASDNRTFYPNAYVSVDDRCPVKYYWLFRSHSPIEMNQSETIRGNIAAYP